MAFVEGGAFKCSQHEYETESVAEWNKHCLSYPDIHYEATVETNCTRCGEKIFLENVPYHPIDENTGSKNISFRCEDCESQVMGNAKRITSKEITV